MQIDPSFLGLWLWWSENVTPR
uniref:Uncharacterized protein n=1 Tax=Anguilla anguilla TaxID=7936 RepID=A0A0E9Q5H2_ANGAN